MTNHVIDLGETTRNYEGHLCTILERKIIDDHAKLLWHGEVTDAGGFVSGDFEHGDAKEFGTADTPSNKELAERFGLTVDELVYPKEKKFERPIKKCPYCGNNEFFMSTSKHLEGEIDEKGVLNVEATEGKIRRINCSMCGKQLSVEDFAEIKGW